MTTTTNTAAKVCGDSTGDGRFTCVLAPHADDVLHTNGTGTSWRYHPDGGVLDEDLLATFPHLLWSNRWNAWWGPNRSGYTNDVWQAGRYTRSEAVAEARCDAHETPPPIVAVPAPEAGLDTFTAAELAGVGELMRRRVAAATAVVIAAHTETRS
jgi:hypothetical protein